VVSRMIMMKMVKSKPNISKPKLQRRSTVHAHSG